MTWEFCQSPGLSKRLFMRLCCSSMQKVACLSSVAYFGSSLSSLLLGLPMPRLAISVKFCLAGDRVGGDILTLLESIPGVNVEKLKNYAKDMTVLSQWVRQGVSIICSLPSAVSGDPVKDFKEGSLAKYQVFGPRNTQLTGMPGNRRIASRLWPMLMICSIPPWLTSKQMFLP